MYGLLTSKGWAASGGAGRDGAEQALRPRTQRKLPSTSPVGKAVLLHKMGHMANRHRTGVSN